MKGHCFEVEGYLCGVQSCDKNEANVFVKIDCVCKYARILDNELQIPPSYTEGLKDLFVNNKHFFLNKIQELNYEQH